MPRSAAQSEAARLRSATVIRHAALELFAEHGFHATTIAHIAKRAGVSKGLVHNYFATKEDLLVAIVVDELLAAPDEVGTSPTVVGPHTPQPERTNLVGHVGAPSGHAIGDPLYRLISRAIQRTLEQPDLYRLFFALVLQPGMTPVLRRIDARIGERLAQEEAELIAAFRESEDPLTDALLFQSTLNGIALTMLIRPGIVGTDAPVNPDALARRVADTFRARPRTPATRAGESEVPTSYSASEGRPA